MSLTKFIKNIKYHQSQPDRPVLSASELKELFDQAGVDIKEYINETLTEEIDSLLNTKLPKSGGTITGTMAMGNNKIAFGNDGNIEWKENGYGDKFRIVPDFTGSGDNNKLLIQATIGGAGEDSNDWVTLAYITAQNGNVLINGAITGTVTNATKWDNYINDLGTENTTDTWLPVLNSGKMQHRTIPNIFSSYFQKLSGTMTVGANDTGVVKLNYPSGFNKDNCYVVGIGLQRIENNGYNWNGIFVNSGSLLMNAYEKYINTVSDGIYIRIVNPNSSSTTFSYRLLLAKF